MNACARTRRTRNHQHTTAATTHRTYHTAHAPTHHGRDGAAGGGRALAEQRAAALVVRRARRGVDAEGSRSLAPAAHRLFTVVVAFPKVPKGGSSARVAERASVNADARHIAPALSHRFERRLLGWHVARWCVWPHRSGGLGAGGAAASASQHRFIFRRRWPSESSNIGHSSARCMYRRNPRSRLPRRRPCTHARTPTIVLAESIAAD